MGKDAYGWIAKRYDAIFDPLNSGLRFAGTKIAPPTAGMTVLDVGCGTGSHLEMYEKADCQVFGIDMSPSMLSVALGKLGIHAGLMLGDARKMPFPDGQFDLITATLTIHEMPATMRSNVLDEMKRTLKPDGRILLIDFHPGSIRFPKGWFYKAVITVSEIAAGREHFRNYRHFMKHGGLPDLVAAHGLMIQDRRIVGGGNMALFVLRKGDKTQE